MFAKSVFEAIESLIARMLVLCVVFVPLGIWKLVDIAIWCADHISVGIK
jgi:uncharacterized membrane protein